MQDLDRSPRSAVIDQILSRREAAYTGCDFIASPANSGRLAQEREVLFQRLDKPVGYFETGPRGPINKDFIQFPECVFRDAKSDHLLPVSWSRRRPLALIPAVSSTSPALPSTSMKSPRSIWPIPSSTRLRIVSVWIADRFVTTSSMVGAARRKARSSSCSMRRSASRTTSLALLKRPLLTRAFTNAAR
jgi:hypothetical protein